MELIYLKNLLDLVPDGLYKNLSKADLNKSLNISDNEYDAVLCVGTFTFGHVKPPALDEFIRITKTKVYYVLLLTKVFMKSMDFIKRLKN